MSKCGVKLNKAPHICAREGIEEDGRCCHLCSAEGTHTPACWIRTYPDILFAEYMGNPNAEEDIIGRLKKAVEATRLVQREITTINRLIWSLNMGHQHRALQSLLHHLEIDLRYIDQEIKEIAG